MKKFLGILAVAAVFASCDNAGSDEQKRLDSLKADSLRMDSINKANAAMPTTPTTATGGDTTGATGATTPSTMGGDTTNKMGGDTMNKRN